MNLRIAATLAALEKNEVAVFAPVLAAQQRKRGKERAYQKARRKKDRAFRMLQVLRCRLNQALRLQGVTKSRNLKTSVTKQMLGCSVPYLMDYLAMFFAPGMSWENYGEWEIDHVKPCRAFDLTKRAEQNQCFHYTNLQPIWKSENRRKNDKWNGISQRAKPLLIMTDIA